MKGASIFKIVGLVLLGVAAAVGIGFLLGLGVMYLWNWLMPVIFGLPEIDYWQAVGLFILCHLLFKSHSAHASKEGKDKGHGTFKARVRSRLHGEKGEDPEAAGEPA